jgi:hypothetical protein
MSTTWELLEGAALCLARSGAIKDRLADCYRNHLALVDRDELPEGLREPFESCHAALTCGSPLPGEDAVRATVRKLSPQQADELACAVVRLFAAMVRESSHASESLLVTGAPRAKTLKAVPQVISLYPAEMSRTTNRA